VCGIARLRLLDDDEVSHGFTPLLVDTPTGASRKSRAGPRDRDETRLPRSHAALKGRARVSTPDRSCYALPSADTGRSDSSLKNGRAMAARMIGVKPITPA
jgi:hypothetical protein